MKLQEGGQGLASVSPEGSNTEFVRLVDRETPVSPRQIALVPGAEAPLLPFDLPPGLRGMAREQIARRQFRDRAGLGEDAIELRPFHAPDGADRWTRAIVAGNERIADWRGLTARAVLPDYLSLPSAEDIWTLATVPSVPDEPNDTIMARLGPYDGFSAAQSLATHLFTRALAEASSPPKALYRLGSPQPGIEAAFASRDIPVLTTPEDFATRDLPVPAILTHGELAFDLRKDPRAARARLRKRVLPWRWPLAGAAIAAALWTAAQLLAIQRLERQATEIDAATRTIVETAFVPQGPVLDVRLQVSRALAEARSRASAQEQDQDPLELFGRAGQVLSRMPADIVQVDFARSAGLTLILQLPDFAAADRLVSALETSGLLAQVRTSRVTEGGTGIEVELAISASDATGSGTTQ